VGRGHGAVGGMSAAAALTHLRDYMAGRSLPLPAQRQHVMAATDALADAADPLSVAARRLIDHGLYEHAAKLLEAASGDLAGQSDKEADNHG